MRPQPNKGLPAVIFQLASRFFILCAVFFLNLSLHVASRNTGLSACPGIDTCRCFTQTHTHRHYNSSLGNSQFTDYFPSQAEARAEFAERSVQKLQKEVDRLEGIIIFRFPNLETFPFYFCFYLFLNSQVKALISCRRAKHENILFYIFNIKYSSCTSCVESSMNCVFVPVRLF